MLSFIGVVVENHPFPIGVPGRSSSEVSLAVNGLFYTIGVIGQGRNQVGGGSSSGGISRQLIGINLLVAVGFPKKSGVIFNPQ